jgi:3-hydroxyisobutyrate dehydrogenase-like beta-hydroxyacid dehydrogenase
MTVIAFTGLGRMGFPIAINLLRAGFAVIGYDLDPAKMAALVERGGKQARSPAEAAALSDLSLSIIMNDAILRDVAMGENGVLKGAQSGHVYCDLSTVSPSASGEVRIKAAEAGVEYLCAKVSGSIDRAESASLTLFASGPADAFTRSHAVFQAMAGSVHYVGEGEAAAYLKLVHSMIVGTYSAMIGEALAFGQKGGLPLGMMIDILEGGPLGSRQLTLKSPVLKERRFDNPPSDIDTAAKDVDIILDTARQDRTPLPLISAARQVMAFAQAGGSGKREIYSVLEAFEQLAGLKVRSDEH